ncbi:MAG: hypothetical protein EI684_10505 [Candidatus Viridilinea halotolerans]|uniref:Dipeptidylpeptidase IV N-terminal domain-containing protein n=1 Tax=Candidatus Viridilinea halotolerans TaxID=2491704 RepID=A0A426U021_9CHLR|nr:MAG: hypothetical protein EI684_10505 [Candidatus Viridilinea halotolerans]
MQEHEGAPAVYVLAQPHGVVQRVATNGLPAHSPAWQPDCAALLVVVTVSEEHQVIYRAYLDGREPTKLSNVHPGLVEHSPAFSPHGDRIVYISNANRQQRFNLHRMRSDGTMVEQLTAYEHEKVVAFRWLDERRLELILETPTHWERIELDLLTQSEHVRYRSNLPIALEEGQMVGAWPQVPQGSTQVRSCWP